MVKINLRIKGRFVPVRCYTISYLSHRIEPATGNPDDDSSGLGDIETASASLWLLFVNRPTNDKKYRKYNYYTRNF